MGRSLSRLSKGVPGLGMSMITQCYRCKSYFLLRAAPGEENVQYGQDDIRLIPVRCSSSAKWKGSAMYTAIEEIQEANKASGQYFFDKETIEFALKILKGEERRGG